LLVFRQAPLAASARGHRLFVPPRGFEQLCAYAAHGYNVLVLAERGGGKTSSLRQLQFMLEKEAHADDPVVAFVDLSAAADVEVALSLLLEAGTAAHSLGNASRTVSRQVRDGQTGALLGALRTLPKCRFLVDNADPSAVAYNLFGTLRDRLWELDHQFVVTADRSDRGAFLRPPADAFWEQVAELDLTDDQAVELISRRTDRDVEWKHELASAVGPHPRRLIAAAQRIVAGQQTAAAVAGQYSLRRDLLDGQSAMSRRLFHELEDLGPMSPSDPRLLRRVEASRPAIDRGLRDLEKAGLARSYFQPDGPGRPRKIYELTQ
jgi:hypothetical protein